MLSKRRKRLASTERELEALAVTDDGAYGGGEKEEEARTPEDQGKNARGGLHEMVDFIRGLMPTVATRHGRRRALPTCPEDLVADVEGGASLCEIELEGGGSAHAATAVASDSADEGVLERTSAGENRGNAKDMFRHDS